MNTTCKMPKPEDPLYQTVWCMNFVNGQCKYGKRCTFAHGESELRAKPQRRDVRKPRVLPEPVINESRFVLREEEFPALSTAIVEEPVVFDDANEPSPLNSTSSATEFVPRRTLCIRATEFVPRIRIRAPEFVPSFLVSA